MVVVLPVEVVEPVVTVEGTAPIGLKSQQKDIKKTLIPRNNREQNAMEKAIENSFWDTSNQIYC